MIKCLKGNDKLKVEKHLKKTLGEAECKASIFPPRFVEEWQS